MKHANILLRDKSTELVNLPGVWPGTLSGQNRTLCQDDGAECFINQREHPNLVTLNNVMLVSSDNYVSIGIRYRLQKLNHVRLKQYRDYSDLNVRAIQFKPDLIILAPEIESEERSALIWVVILTRLMPGVKLLIINRRNGLMQNLSKILPYYYLKDTATPEELDKAIIQALTEPVKAGFSLSKYLTKRQWCSLCVLANGMSISSAARSMHIGVKTLYTHRSRAMARLGINNRLHEAWMTDAIKLLNQLVSSPI